MELPIVLHRRKEPEVTGLDWKPTRYEIPSQPRFEINYIYTLLQAPKDSIARYVCGSSTQTRFGGKLPANYDMFLKAIMQDIDDREVFDDERGTSKLHSFEWKHIDVYDA